MWNNKIKWITKSQFVDIHTGELITKSDYERNYIKIKTTKTIEINGNFGFRNFTTECQRSIQLKIEF